MNRWGGTYLTHIVHDAAVAPLDGLIKIRILKHDARALAAAFQGDVLQIAAGRLHDGSSGDGAASKGNLVDVHVACKSLTGDVSKTGNDVDHSRWEASLDNELAKV